MFQSQIVVANWCFTTNGGAWYIKMVQGVGGWCQGYEKQQE